MQRLEGLAAGGEAHLASHPRPFRPAQSRAWTLDLGLLAAVGLLALVLRLLHFDILPRFTDETGEVMHALAILRGDLLVLTNVNAYNGSLWNWLVAAVLLVTGNSLLAPRALALGFGVATVLVSYMLGRAWGGRLGGVVTAALLGTAGVHILVNSRVAWGNCITPLFTTLGVWLLYRAVGPGARFGSLLLAGLCWGLAFQTHPSVVALLPAVAAYFIWQRRTLLRTHWPYLAAGLFLLMNVNLLIFNLTSGLGSLTEGIGKAGAYQESISDRFVEGSDAQGAQGYLLRLGWLLTGLMLTLGGAVDGEEKQVRSLLDPALWPIAALSFAGLAWQWRRGNPLPAMLLASAALVLPLFNGKYDPVFNGRYLMPLLPVLFASAAALISALAGFLSATPHSQATRAGLALAAVFVVLHPLSYLVVHVERELERGRTNERYFGLLEQVERVRGARPLVLDTSLREAESPGGGTAYKTLSLALALAGVPYRLSDLGTHEPLGPAERCQEALAVFWVGWESSGRSPEQLGGIADRLDLRELDGSRVGRVRAGRFYTFHLDRVPTQAAGCG